VPSHLADPALHDFAGIEARGRPEEDGDLAFDAEVLPMQAFALGRLQSDPR
jgi:tRNA 2-thiocytidine biosynthesis protein TtcA